VQAWQMQQLGDPWDLLVSVESAPPAVTQETIRVKVEATDLNFADILQCQGKYQVRREPPFTPGLNTAGTIAEVPPELASGWAVGQRVVGPTVGQFGGFAEEALMLASQTTLIPTGVSTLSACASHVTYGTSWFALHHRGQLRAGETVLVLAAGGGVGSSAVELAKVHGCWVIAAAGGAAKVAACQALGADEVVDYNQEDLYARVMALTDGRGVDVVYDPVGGEYFDVARRLVAWEGRLLVIGFASGTIPKAPLNHVLVKNYSVVGVHMGGYRQHDDRPFSQCYEMLHRLLLEEKINPLIDEVIGFDKLPPTLQKLANRLVKGRVIFDPKA